MVYFANIGEDIKFAALGTIRTLLLTLCEFIYQSIYFCYNLFQRIGNAQIMDSTAVQSLYQKVGLLLGLYMIFRLTFSFIQYILNPDSMTDKQKGMGNVIKKVLIVIVLLGITPTIFKTAYSLQRLIINENVIPKLITGYSTSEENFGGELTWYLFSSFYKQDEEVTPNDGEECPELDSDLIGAYIKDDADFSYAYNCLNNRGENVSTSKESFVIAFNGFFALAAGIAVLWMIVSYTISVGVRLIQLAYLQLVAPIPIMMYLEPKEDGTFKKWVKQCTTTYIDFFLRTAIIFFTITIIQVIMKTGTGTFYESVGGFANGWEALYTQIIMIIALMVFAKKVPDLLKELFPMSGGAASLGFGLKPTNEMKKVGLLGAGAIAGGAIGLIGGGPKGFIGGITKGAYSGFKGKKPSEVASARAAQNRINRQAKEDGSTFLGRTDESIRNVLGLDSGTQMIDNKIRDIDESAVMKSKKKNDTIIGARKAMMDEAEKELLKAGSGNNRLREMKANIEWAKSDFANGGRTTAADILHMEDTYKETLKRESATWIDSNLTSNAVVASNMEIISNETGTRVNSATAAERADSAAKSENSRNAATITDMEYQKKELEKQKKVAQANENAVKRK